MKIAIATNRGGLDDTISLVFGRCQTFTLVEIDNKEIKDTKVIPNESLSAPGGAGIQASQLMIEKKVDTVIAGNFGPNAVMVLKKAGIGMVQAQGNVKEVLEKYLNGEIKAINNSTVGEHFGMGSGRRMWHGGRK